MSADSDNDDDFPQFLPPTRPVRTVNEVLTPKKPVRPLTDPISPLTPMSLFAKSKPRAQNSKAKLSLFSLLNDKQSDDIVEKRVEDIEELQNVFDEKIASPVKEVEPTEELNYSQLSQSQEYDFSQDASQDKHSQNPDISEKERKKLNQITKFSHHDFPDNFPGKEIFIKPASTINKKECLAVVINYMLGEFDINEIEQDTESAYEYLQMVIPDMNGYPTEVCFNLLQLMLTEEYQISQLSYTLLKTVLISEIENTADTWILSTKNFLEAIHTLGADMRKLIPIDSPEELISFCSSLEENQEEQFLNLKTIRRSFSSRLHCFAYLVKLLSVSIQRYPSRYTVEEKNALFVVAFKLSIERVVQLHLWDIKVLIGTVINSYSEDKWKQQIIKISLILCDMKVHHHNLLHMVESIPCTKRGTLTQQYYAYVFASWIRYDEKPTDLSLIVNKPRDIVTMVNRLIVDNDSDYYQLNSFFMLIGKSLLSEKIIANQKANAETLISYLRRIHGDIKECRGVFFDRTKVKDVILRLVSKLTFTCQNLKTQKHLESYFERSDKPMLIENLEQGILSSLDEEDSEAVMMDTT